MTDNGISKDAHRGGEEPPLRSFSYKVGSGCATAFLWLVILVVVFGIPASMFSGMWLHILKRCFEAGWGYG
jgi:hypothetical protein